MRSQGPVAPAAVAESLRLERFHNMEARRAEFNRKGKPMKTGRSKRGTSHLLSSVKRLLDESRTMVIVGACVFMVPSMARSAAAVCSDNQVISHYWSGLYTVEGGQFGFTVTSAAKPDQAGPRLFGMPGPLARHNLYNLDTRQDRYAEILLEVATLSNFEPVRVREFQRAWLAAAPRAVRESDLYPLLTRWLQSTLSGTSTFPEISAAINTGLPVDLDKLLTGLAHLADVYTAEAAPQEVDVFRNTPTSVYLQQAEWVATRKWIEPIAKGAKYLSLAQAYLNLDSARRTALATTFWTVLMSNQAALDRLSAMKTQLVNQPIWSDPAFQGAMSSAEAFLVSCKLEQTIRVMVDSLVDELPKILSGTGTLLDGVFCDSIIAKINSTLVEQGLQEISKTAAASIGCYVFVIKEGVVAFFKLKQQYENLELSIVASTLGNNLCWSAANSYQMRFPATFTYWVSMNYCLKAFDWEPVPLWNYISGANEAIQSIREVTSSFWGLTLSEYAASVTPPCVVSTSAGRGPGTDIHVIFAKDMSHATVSAANISVVGSSSQLHTVALNFDHASNTLVITPQIPLTRGETVFVVLKAGLTDNYCNGLDGDCDGVVGPDYSFSFQIESGQAIYLTSSAGVHGSVSPAGTVGVMAGSNQSFTASPEVGFEVEAWYCDGAEVQTGGSNYTLQGVQGSHSVYVTFKRSNSYGLVVAAPNGGGTYARGRKLYINWRWDGAIGQYVNIELLKGGSLNRLIAGANYNTGYYSWDIPSDQALGSEYRVRVSAVAGTLSDVSDADFTITTNTPAPASIQIWTLADLQALSEHWGDSGHPSGGNYVLMADIDASATANWNSGSGFKPIGTGPNDYFRGTFDGKGHTISGVYIRRTNEAYAAIFTVALDSALIKNLKLEVRRFFAEGYLNRGGTAYGGVGGVVGENSGVIKNCQVTVTYEMYVLNGSHCGGIAAENYRGRILNCTVLGPGNVEAKGTGAGDGIGGIAGVNSSSGLIRWCRVGPDLDVDANVGGSNGDHSGGIVGQNEGGRVAECESRARWVDGRYGVGGVVGYNEVGGEIRDCYFRDGTVNGSGLVGGGVGWIDSDSGAVSNCFASGPISGSGDRGALVGRNLAYLGDSYWNREAYGLLGAGSGSLTRCVGKTAAEMRQKTTFTNWDFQAVWSISEGVDFPFLRGVGECLSAPTGIVASSGFGDGVHLTWSPVLDATWYRVFRSDIITATPELVSGGGIAGLQFVDSSAAPDTTFYYWVTAATTSDGGRESELSAPAQGTRVLGPVVAPQNVLASVGLVNQTAVTWDAVRDAGYYQVFRSETLAGTKVPLTLWQTNTLFSDNPPAADTAYYYWVRAAVTSAGERASDYSQAATGSFSVPDREVPMVSILCLPSRPIETQCPSLVATGVDNRALESLTVCWDDGTLHSNYSTFSGTNRASVNVVTPAVGGGQALTFWALAQDQSGNRAETAHQTLTVDFETLSVPWIPWSLTGGGTPGQIVQVFTGGSTTSLGGGVEYEFDWGDGSVAAWGGTNQTHVWNGQGSYVVQVRGRSQARTSRLSDWSAPYLVNVALPALTFSTRGSAIVLAWPTNDQSFALEWSSDLRATNWHPAEALPSVVNGMFMLTNSTAMDAYRFYRLKK